MNTPHLAPSDYVAILQVGRDFNVSRNVFIYKKHKKNWDALAATSSKNLYRANIVRMVFQLGGIAKARDNNINDHIGDGLKFIYIFDSKGDVYIQSLLFSESFERPGLQQDINVYRTKANLILGFDRPYWKTLETAVQQINLKHKWDGENGSHRIAVAGKYKNKEQAGSMLISHIQKGFCLSDDITSRDGNHYSLVWLNGQFNNKKSVDLILDIVFYAAIQNESLDWLVHGDSCATFVAVMEELPKHARYKAVKNSSNAMEKQNFESALKKQRVIFSNPRGKTTNVRKEKLEKLCNACGLHYQDTHITPYDWHNPDVRDVVVPNFGGGLAKIGHAGAAITGYAYVLNFLQSDAPLINKIGLGVGATFVVTEFAKKHSAYINHLPDAWKSTLGDGHLHW